METLAAALYVVIGVVNLLPVTGALSADRLRGLYGVSLEDPNLIILMRHRAVLFAIVGALLLAAAFHAPIRLYAVAAGLVSMLSFVLVAYRVGGFNAALRRVLVVDLVASLLLVVAALVTLGPS